MGTPIKLTDLALERFWENVTVDESTGCWNWIGWKNKWGYGVFSELKKLIPAHRFSYRVNRGPIPEGLQIDHLCRNRACVNPDHMEAVSPKENYLRGISPPANNARKTHCSQGHPLSGDNLYIRPGGERNCRKCSNLDTQSWKQKNKSKYRLSRQITYFKKQAELISNMLTSEQILEVRI